uniref:Transmembrane protein n=1 Tax=Fagus sylvatica TaxID=28930 RepID=A0A2N9HIM8_FAGSY
MGFGKSSTILMMIVLVIFVVISCHTGVEATRTLKEDFASSDQTLTYSTIYEKAKYTMENWLQRLPSGPSPSGPGH